MLQRRFMEARSRRQARLIVATTPRILAEDLPECVVEFTKEHPGEYPLLNADHVTKAILERAGYSAAPTAVVETVFAATIRRYAALGVGLGLVRSLPAPPRHARVHEQDMSRHFGRLVVCRLSRKRVPLSAQAIAFSDLVRQRLNASSSDRS
jgi:hypothetical protein